MIHKTRPIAFVSIVLLSSVAVPLAAEAGDWSNASSYNGYGATTQNTTSNYSIRDANGNLTISNGQVTSASANSGTQSSYSGGVGSGSSYGLASAIGNSLNVTVTGSHNTTIVSSTQINNGNQIASVELNSH